MAAKIDIASPRLRFIFQGKCLENNLKIVKDYGLKNDMALHVVEVDPTAPPLSASRNPPRTERLISNTIPVAATFVIHHNSIFDDYRAIRVDFNV